MSGAESTRRGFLKAAAASPVGASALAQSPSARVLGANDTVRIGLIGCGGMGGFDLLAFQKTPGVKAVALCDVDQTRLQKTAEKAGGEVETYSDFRRLIDRKDIDAGVIAPPD